MDERMLCLINAVDAELHRAKRLTELAFLLQTASHEYFERVVLLLEITGESVQRLQMHSVNLAAQLRSCGVP
jgi:hypothetical protein